MSRQRSLSGVESDFVEADLDAIFALLYFAELAYLSGAHQDASSALEEAEAARCDGQQRLRGLEDEDLQRFRPQLERLRHVIAGMKSRFSID
jgi:hypothetical protein